MYLCNGEMYNFVIVCRLILSYFFIAHGHGFPEIVPVPVQLPLKST